MVHTTILPMLGLIYLRIEKTLLICLAKCSLMRLHNLFQVTGLHVDKMMHVLAGNHSQGQHPNHWLKRADGITSKCVLKVPGNISKMN